jgi:hypothetical protein
MMDNQSLLRGSKSIDLSLHHYNSGERSMTLDTTHETTAVVPNLSEYDGISVAVTLRSASGSVRYTASTTIGSEAI